MALSQQTFGDIGGAVSDLFGGFGAEAQGDLKAKGLDIEAQGLRLKAQGDLAEASNYDLASTLAAKNAVFTQSSTAIQMLQQERQNTMQIGGQQAAIAGAGFAASGSALDLMADSARQGALATAVLGQQGLITEAGYQEQAQSYTTMATAARADAAGQNQIAGEEEQLAQETKDAANTASIGDFLGGVVKGAAAIATLL
jgi:hypothetical protein